MYRKKQSQQQMISNGALCSASMQVDKDSKDSSLLEALWGTAT